MEKLSEKELENLDIAIKEMNKMKDEQETISIEKWLEELLRKRDDIHNQILEYQLNYNMSWPFDLILIKCLIWKK